MDGRNQHNILKQLFSNYKETSFFFFLKKKRGSDGLKEVGRETGEKGDVSQAWKENTARAESRRLGPCLACGRKGESWRAWEGSEWVRRGRAGGGGDREVTGVKGTEVVGVGPVSYGSYGGYPSFKKKIHSLHYCHSWPVGSWFPTTDRTQHCGQSLHHWAPLSSQQWPDKMVQTSHGFRTGGSNKSRHSIS